MTIAPATRPASLRTHAWTSSGSGESPGGSFIPLERCAQGVRPRILAAAMTSAASKRQVNDLILRFLDGEPGPDPIAFVCECSTEGCFGTVWLTAAEFETGRTGSEGWLVLAPTH